MPSHAFRVSGGANFTRMRQLKSRRMVSHKLHPWFEFGHRRWNLNRKWEGEGEKGENRKKKEREREWGSMALARFTAPLALFLPSAEHINNNSVRSDRTQVSTIVCFLNSIMGGRLTERERRGRRRIFYPSPLHLLALSLSADVNQVPAEAWIQLTLFTSIQHYFKSGTMLINDFLKSDPYERTKK